MHGIGRSHSCARTAAESLRPQAAVRGTPDTLRVVEISPVKSRTRRCCRCMCRRRLGCRGSRSGAGPLVLDRCSRLCRHVRLRLRIGRERVGAELLQQPKGLRDLGSRRWTGSGGVWLVVELAKLWESVEEVKGRGCSLEERTGTGRSSCCLCLG